VLTPAVMPVTHTYSLEDSAMICLNLIDSSFIVSEVSATSAAGHLPQLNRHNLALVFMEILGIEKDILPMLLSLTPSLHPALVFSTMSCKTALLR